MIRRVGILLFQHGTMAPIFTHVGPGRLRGFLELFSLGFLFVPKLRSVDVDLFKLVERSSPTIKIVFLTAGTFASLPTEIKTKKYSNNTST